MQKSRIRIFAVMLVTVLCFTALSTTAFASDGGEDTTEPITTETPFAPLSSEGNLTLVNDVKRTDEIDKQFITAVSQTATTSTLSLTEQAKWTICICSTWSAKLICLPL
ncbi:MAG: hypothetical protein RSB02_06150 [Anaerovoracaceae bacterium]